MANERAVSLIESELYFSVGSFGCHARGGKGVCVCVCLCVFFFTLLFKVEIALAASSDWYGWFSMI